MRKITVRTFPSKEGDTVVEVLPSELAGVLEQGNTVTMDGKAYTDWNELLKDIQSKPESEPVEVLQFREVVGG